MKVKVKKLNEDAQLPKYATGGSAGFDLVAIEDVTIPYGQTGLVKTGLSFEIPEGYEMQVRPRSGNSLKTKLRVANSPGTIDSDYRGEVGIIVDNTTSPDTVEHNTFGGVGEGFGRGGGGIRILGKDIEIKKGDRVAQGVIAPVVQAKFQLVKELSDTKRGGGGFGSTGKR